MDREHLEGKIRELVSERRKAEAAVMKPSDYELWRESIVHSELFQKQPIDGIASLVGDLVGRRILDIGCGTGGFTVALNLAHIRAYGCDLNEQNVRISKLRAMKYKFPCSVFQIADGARLPYRDESFDVVTMFQVLEHVADPNPIIKEVWRVLKKGGYFYSETPNKFWPLESHVNMLFSHWMPVSFRKPYLMKFRREKAAAENFLLDINYVSPREIMHVIESLFSECILNDRILARKARTGSIKRRDDGFLRFLAKRVCTYRLLWPFFSPLLKQFSPSIRILAKK